MRKFVFLVGLLSVVLLTQCNIDEIEVDNLSLPNLQQNVAVPIGEVSYTLRELLLEEILDSTDVSNFTAGSDSVITFIFRDSINFSARDQIIEVMDADSTFSIDLPAVPVPVPADTTVGISRTFEFEYQPGSGEILDSAVHESGMVDFAIRSDLSSPMNFRFTLDNTVDRTSLQPLEFSGTVSNADGTVMTSQSLMNHVTSVEDTNRFEFSLEATIFLSVGQSIDANDRVRFTLGFRDQVFEAIFGFFGQDTVQLGTESINVSFFDELGEGILFQGPELNIAFDNSIGVPFGLTFASISGTSAVTGNTSSLTGTITESPQLIDFPTLAQFGETVMDTLIIDENNSDLPEFFNTSPNQIDFELSAVINPFSTTTRENFVTNTGEINANIEMRLPLTLQINNLTRSEDFGYGNIEADEADSVVIRLVTQNELPLNATAIVQVLDDDETRTVLFETDQTLFLASPFISAATGEIISPEVNIATVTLGREGVDAVREGSVITVILTFNTPETLNSQEIFVDFETDQTLDLKVSIIAGLDIDI